MNIGIGMDMKINFENPMDMGVNMGITFENGYGCRLPILYVSHAHRYTPQLTQKNIDSSSIH